MKKGAYYPRRANWGGQNQFSPYEKLDRVLMDMDFESKFPLVSVRALERIVDLSDHAPILLTTGLDRPPCPPRFKFELGWLQRDGFHEMVKRIWERPVVGCTPIQRWNNKIRATRTHLMGWARHTAGLLKKEKLRLVSIIDNLEALAKNRLLSTHEIELKSQSNAQLAGLPRERFSTAE